MVENVDDAIDLDRLTSELEKFNDLIKEGEDSDGGDTCIDNHWPEVDGSPSSLTKYLLSVAKTGDLLVPWKTVTTFIRHKIDSILTSFYEKYGIEDIDSQNLPPFNYIPSKEKLLQHFDTFTGAPFTIQRLCEILIDPGRHYKRTDKLLRGLEKNILVVSTVGRLSDDCSDPQQRSLLFNGLHMTPLIRSFRPPLPDHVDKFPISNDDSDMKDDEGGPQQHNGDDSGLLENEEPSFEEECLKHDMEDDEMEELDDELRPRLGCGSALAGALAGTGSGHPGLEGYSLSANSVISVRRKRKEEHKQHVLHSKRIRMEHAAREQQLQQEASLACKEDEEEDAEEEVIIGPMPLEAMDTSCDNRLSSSPGTPGKGDSEVSSSGSEDEQSIAMENGSPSKSSAAQRVLASADDASKSSCENEAPMLTKDESVSDQNDLPEVDTSASEEAMKQAPEDDKNSGSPVKSEGSAGLSDQTKQDVKQTQQSASSDTVPVTALATEEEEAVAASKLAAGEEKIPASEPAASEECPMEQDPPEPSVTDGSKAAAREEAHTPKALGSAPADAREDAVTPAAGITEGQTTAASDDKEDAASSSAEIDPEQEKPGPIEEKVEEEVQAKAPEAEKVQSVEREDENFTVTEQASIGSSEVPSSTASTEEDVSTQCIEKE